MKVSTLKINISLLNNCFSSRNVLQNGINALSKMVLKNSVFCEKAQNFVPFCTVRFGSNFGSMLSKYLANNVWREVRLSMSAFATVARKSYNGKFTAKIAFPIGHFNLPLITDADIGSLKSLHTLFDKHLDRMLVKFEQDRFKAEIYIVLRCLFVCCCCFFLQKMVNHL